jgi:acyl-CoA thioesterase I
MNTCLLILSLFVAPLISAQDQKTPFVIIALGDSITEGYGLAKEEAYPALLQESLQHTYTTGVRIINAGVSGSTSASGESRLKWQLKNKPNMLFLALGANDGLRGLSTSSMKQNLQKTIELAQANKVHVILAGMRIPMNYGDDYRQKYEAVFSDLAKMYKLDFVPFLLDGVATKKDLNLPDGIHPNSAGYKIIADKLLPVFKNTIDKIQKQKGQK